MKDNSIGNKDCRRNFGRQLPKKSNCIKNRVSAPGSPAGPGLPFGWGRRAAIWDTCPGPPLTMPTEHLHAAQLSCANGVHTADPLPSCREGRLIYEKLATSMKPSDGHLSCRLRKQLMCGRWAAESVQAQGAWHAGKEHGSRMRRSDAAKMRANWRCMRGGKYRGRSPGCGTTGAG